MNKQWRLASHPAGMPTKNNWVMAEGTVPEPGCNQLLVRALLLDVAPSLRGRISPQRNYSAGVTPGDLMVGCAVGEVVESNVDGFQRGDVVVTDTSFGWQQYAAIDPQAVRKINLDRAPAPCWLDFLGFNGVTAYVGMKEVANVRSGDNVVVSAAAGSVGQIAGQVARLSGARTIAVTSSPAKAVHCLQLGYDEAIDYRINADLAGAIAKACPGGVDVFFDNTAGDIHDAVMQNLAIHARIALCGTISLASTFDQPDMGQRFLRQILVARARLQGFLVVDYESKFNEAWDQLLAWYRSGDLKCHYDVLKGIENMPRAFLRLLHSENLGKQVVEML
jgi:NADPH-dependent curcumin reductase CurA